MDRYEEALKTATQWIKDGCTDKEKICLESVFPELRESDDERMLKRIINILGSNTDAHEEGWVVYVDEIAWLEKQKEDKNELVYRMNGLMQEYVRAGKDDEEKDHRYECYRLFWDALEDSEFFKKEQKPAEWSEEDEKTINMAIETLEHEDYLILADRLKSLRPQPKQEWSEKDEKMLKTLVDFYESFEEDESFHETTYGEIANWLKSLRPQPGMSKEDFIKFGNLEYERGKRDGYREGFDEGYKKANEAMSFHYDMFHNSTPCYAPGGVCTNPQMDCMNCPRQSACHPATTNISGKK